MKKLKYVLVAVVLIFVVALSAPFTNYIGVQTARFYNEIFLYNTSGTQVFGLSNTGTVTGSRGYLADSGSFATPTGLFSKAVYVAGGTSSDLYVVTRRVVLGVSTAKQTDTSILSYMAKTDSLIVFRTDTTTSGLKFSWIRIK